MRSITDDQVKFYNEVGYLIVENVLSQDEIEELGAITDTFVEKSNCHESLLESSDLSENRPKHHRKIHCGWVRKGPGRLEHPKNHFFGIRYK